MGSYIELNYGGITTITDFTGGVTGQRLVIAKVGGGTITITDGTNIFLKSSKHTTGPEHTAIITADGYYLHDYKLIASKKYQEEAIGNVKEMRYEEYLERLMKGDNK